MGIYSKINQPSLGNSCIFLFLKYLFFFYNQRKKDIPEIDGAVKEVFE